MDETFRDARGALVSAPCVFEKALLTRCADCSRAQRRALAEQEAVDCGDTAARQLCAEALALLQANARFALRQPRLPDPLPHGMLMRLQCGGLRGLAAVAEDDGLSPPPRPAAPSAGPAAIYAGAAPVSGPPDVGGVLQSLAAAHGGLENLPWSRVVQQVAAWSPRRRSPGGTRP